MAEDRVALSVRKVPERSRYELVDGDDVVGIATYHEHGDRIVLPHTEIATHRRGEGLGAVLVGGVLDDVRAAGGQVVPQCWYVGQFLDEHPDYADLVADR